MFLLSMWETTLLVLAMAHLSSEELIGSNVCHVEKRFIVNSTEYFIRNSTVRNYQWCMNVPPRCSYYTLKQVNASRIVEKEVKRAVPECCPGYEEQDNSCVQICHGCLHGECNGGKCSCHPGFQGDTCDRGCEPMKWGTNCKFNCTCERGTCLPITGNCICPSGWNGTKCQHQCPQGSYGINCTEKCRCNQDELCHHITGECEKLPTTQLSSTTSSAATTTTQRSTESATTPSTTTVQTNTVLFKNNGKFKPNQPIVLDNLTSSASDETSDEIPFLVIDEQEKSIIPPSISDEDRDEKKSNGEERGFHNKNPQVFKSSNDIIRSTTVFGSLLEKENYLKDEAIREENINNNPPSNKTDMANGASAATAISVALIVIVLAVIAAKSFKRKKENARKKEATRTTNGVSRVSVYTHSIFHTPLPDPPPFENPVFIPPTENGDGKRFETRVVCSMNFPVPQEKDPREYLYDHPPSTGSYRAVSIPEPPDIDNMSLAVQTFPLSEPVYDEIPTGMAPTPVSEPPPSYKSSSLYMNTCGKTRL